MANLPLSKQLDLSTPLTDKEISDSWRDIQNSGLAKPLAKLIHTALTRARLVNEDVKIAPSEYNRGRIAALKEILGNIVNY